MVVLILVLCLIDEGISLLRFMERVGSDPYGVLLDWKFSDSAKNPCFWLGVNSKDDNVYKLDEYGQRLVASQRSLLEVMAVGAYTVLKIFQNILDQISFGLLFSLVITFISDALSTVPDKASMFAGDTFFVWELHELVIAIGNDPNGLVNGTGLAWTEESAN